MDNDKKIDDSKPQTTDEDIELVSIEDLRTSFGGEDLAGARGFELNEPTRMCGGW